MKTFYFNTGVNVYAAHNQPDEVMPGNVVCGGILLIPFKCKDVPENAIFKFACDTIPPGSEHLLKRKIHESNLVSKYAFFLIP